MADLDATTQPVTEEVADQVDQVEAGCTAGRGRFTKQMGLFFIKVVV